MNRETKSISNFVTFCLEAYKRTEDIEGAEAVETFIKYGVIEYLKEGYDVLHSLGERALIADIQSFIKLKKNQLIKTKTVVY
jgi:hypothetical protein